jgi:glucose-6-phosphate-specific signal transduction histidine kinase
MNRIRSMQLLRRQIRGNLAEEVSTTLNNINVLSEMAKIKADRNVEQAKGFIDHISEKSRQMMEVMDDTLWSIDPQNDSMGQTLLRIKEITEGIKATYEVDVDLIVDNKVNRLHLDMKVRHDLLFFYKEAMNYLVQNICCKQIFVNMNMVRGKLMIEILSECDCDKFTNLESHFQKALQKRIKALPATIDVLVDGKSLSVVLLVDVKR